MNESWVENLFLLGMVSSIALGIVSSDRFGLPYKLLGGPPALLCFGGLFYSRRKDIPSSFVLPVFLLFGALISVLTLEAYHHVRGSIFDRSIGMNLIIFGPWIISTAWAANKEQKDKE